MDTLDLEGPRAICKAISFGSLRKKHIDKDSINSSAKKGTLERKMLLAASIGGHLQSSSLSKLRAVVVKVHNFRSLLSVLIIFSLVLLQCFTEELDNPDKRLDRHHFPVISSDSM